LAEEKLKEERKKEELRRLQEEMKWRLDIQIQEKRARLMSERAAND
jgi:hypothetical protein